MASAWLYENVDFAGFVAGSVVLFAWLDAGLRRRSTPARLSRVFWWALAVPLLLGFWVVDMAGRKPQERLVTLLEGMAPTYAMELERMGHAELKIETAAEDPRYLKMIEILKAWVAVNPQVSDIYTFRRAADGTVVFLVDAETDYDRDGKYTGAREQRTSPGEVYPQAGEEVARAFAGEGNFMERPMTDRWGTWVSAQVPMRDAQGRVEAVLGVDYPASLWTEEATARRRVALLYLGVMVLILAGSGATLAITRAELRARGGVEARLRTSDARLRAMLDHLPFAVWLLDGDGRCRAHNLRAAKTRGLAEGRTLAELDFEPGEGAALEEDCRRARDGAVVTREVERRTEGGTRHCFQLFAPVMEGGTRAGLVGVELDVTDRVEAERARHRSERRLALHFEQSPLAYIEWGPDRRILRWNPAAERIFGYAAQEAMGRPFEELIVPEQALVLVREVAGMLLERKGGSHSINENRTRDGRTITCEWHNTPLVDTEGRVVAVSSHGQDITERVALEQRLRQSQRLESIGQLASGVAHEFNNLLTPMLMQMGQIGALYEKDARLLGLLRPVEDAVLQAADLNQRILAVGRRAADAPGPMEINPLIEAAAELLRHTLDRRIEMRLELGAGLPPALVTKGAMTQVVMNLALNARDALMERMERGAALTWTPRITLTTRLTDVVPLSAPEALRAAGACVVLRVQDNGEGMSEEVRRRAFEPFFTTKASGHGTGLGLAVVWNVVEGLGGVVELESKAGAGTEFTLYLPAARRDGAKPAAAGAVRSGLAGVEGKPEPLRVLLVEDNELVRETFREVLSQAGHVVACAEDGEAAWTELVKAERAFDVLVTDLNMPSLSGRGLIERMQGRGLAHGILVVSGVVESAMTDELRRLGVSRVLRKPLGMGELLAAVAEVGRRRGRMANDQ